MAGCECNKCEKVFEMSLANYKEKREDELEFSFFVCPHCGAKYPVYVTDAALRQAISAVPYLSNTARQMREQGKFDAKLAEQIKTAIGENQKRCAELIAEHWERFAGKGETDAD